MLWLALRSCWVTGRFAHDRMVSLPNPSIAPWGATLPSSRFATFVLPALLVFDERYAKPRYVAQQVT
jgi:hypothetical protein